MIRLIEKFDLSLLSIPKLKLHFRYLIPLIFGNKDFEVEIDGLRITLRPRTYDLFILSEIFFEGSYHFLEIDKEKIDTVVDLGANIGIFSLWVAGNYLPAKVVSVEMDKDNFELLNTNIDKNYGTINSEFIPINKAVYSAETTLSYEKVPINKGMHTLSEQKNMRNTVDTITLAHVISKSNSKIIDCMKIDIEGSEKYILNESNKEIFADKVRYIVMEVHVGKDFKLSDVERYFSEIGYKYRVIKNWYSANYMFFGQNTGLSKGFTFKT